MLGEAVSPLINLFTPTLPAPLQHEEARQGALARQAEEGAVQGAIRRELLVTTLGMGDQLLKVWGSTNMGDLRAQSRSPGGDKGSSTTWDAALFPLTMYCTALPTSSGC